MPEHNNSFINNENKNEIFADQLTEPLTTLPGIGKRGAENFLKIGVRNCGDLLRHYPSRYEDRSTLRPLSAFNEGPVYTEITVIAHDYLFLPGKANYNSYKQNRNGKTLKVFIEDSQNTRAALICFGRNFLEKTLSVGSRHKIYATFQYKYGEIQTSAFDIEPSDPTVPDIKNPFLPVYPATENLSQKTIRNAVSAVIRRHLSRLTEPLPFYLRESYNLLPQKKALESVHFPSTATEIEEARKTLIVEEIFLLQLSIARESMKTEIRRNPNRINEDKPGSLFQRVKESLPFRLTGDQERALNDILGDIREGRVMHRLLQGEVGSGKTLVAFLSALLYLDNFKEQGGQAALMVPTELLARQHYENALRLLSPFGVKIGLLTGSLPPAEREQTVREISDGEIPFIIGTHSLFSENISFHRLVYVILDEQHRFGVNQRRALIEKGLEGDTTDPSDQAPPDTLLMSATPIPRTLALTAYGNLTVSTIKELPRGRQPIETHLARQGNEQKVYDFVKKELTLGRQAYFVYPLIAQSEKIDLKDAESMYEKLSTEIFPQYQTALLHSRLPDEEKASVMHRFQNGEVQILIATSVVEVGVDIPNATIMVIEQAERFGLSALHQLRGRVGRGQYASYAFLVYGNNLTEEGKQRLMVMKENSDGFLIAEEDLKIRGPGEITGERQSGYYNLRIASYSRDWDIWKATRESVRKIMEEDPGLLLEKNSKLRQLFEQAPPFPGNCTITG